jgi:hypothetical protein
MGLQIGAKETAAPKKHISAAEGQFPDEIFPSGGDAKS